MGGEAIRKHSVRRTATHVMAMLCCVALTWLGTGTAGAETRCQPDLQVACKGGEYVGRDVYTTDVSIQAVTGTAGARATIDYWIAVQNDGSVADRFVLKEREGMTHSKWIRRYFDAQEGGNDITEDIGGDGWTTPVLSAGAVQVIRLSVVPGAGADSQSTALVATSALTAGDLNLNPGMGAGVRFEMVTAQGLIDIQTLHDNGAGYTYEGAATEVRIKPKGQGRTLQHDGRSLTLAPSTRYVLTSGAMTVKLRNLQPNANNWNQANGHWWLKVSAAAAVLEPNPVEGEEPPSDVVGITSARSGAGQPVRVKRWQEVP